MRYLYVLLVLSLAVLLWAAMAIARHIRRHEAPNAGSDVELARSEPDAGADAGQGRDK